MSPEHNKVKITLEHTSVYFNLNLCSQLKKCTLNGLKILQMSFYPEVSFRALAFVIVY